MAELSGEIAIGVLGPLAVSVGGRPVELTTPRLRTLLAVLAMSAGRPVSIERQAAALWDEDPPDNARRNVQTYLARLRGALGVGAIAAGPDGYRLRAEPDRVDALKFVTLLDAAARTPDASAERARLREALALWRGAPFEGMRSSWLERSEAPRLLERYLAAVERRIDIDLALGQPGELTADLSQLIARHPLRESLWERLLVVLDHTGRQAEALERYESIRRQLADELGTDPGPRLRRIHADLLRREPPGQRPGETMPAISGSQVVPKQLPAGVDGFTGREAALTVLNHLIRDDDQGRATGTVAIAAITGAAGVGKTALAVHWAHQVADRFPDGQLYLNLRGFGPSGAAALDPADAARRCLDALGVPPHRVPADLDAQLGLYRSLLAGRRMLIVLDNARDADQVGPLLPGSPTCLALVTSRDQLARLVASTAASSVLLDLLTVDEARGLLAHRLGADRVAAEPQATDEIITRCARLPLALAIAAARATTNPAFPLRALASELRDAQSGLDTLTVGDPGTEVRTVFSWSYRVASPAAARLFRLLSLHPGPDLRLPAAASLAGLSTARARPLLAELTRAHLLTEHVPGRYTFHDLLRAYATELSQAHDSHQQRQQALRRLLDHYLHTGHTAALVLRQHRDPIRLAAPAPGATVIGIPDYPAALAWFTDEYPVLLGVIDRAARAGFDTHAWQIPWTLSSYFDIQGRWQDRKAVEQTALAATRRLGDRTGQAIVHRSLAGALVYLSRFDDARAHLETALGLFAQLGDPAGQALTQINLAQVFGRQRRFVEALHHSQQALKLYQDTGQPAGYARALNAVGWDHAHLGNYQHAIDHCQRALEIQREIGHRAGEAATLDSLGYAHYGLGDYERATACYQRAIDLYRQGRSRYLQADTLISLGDTRLAAGDPDAAGTVWRQALTILEELDHPDADRVRTRLPGVRPEGSHSRP